MSLINLKRMIPLVVSLFALCFMVGCEAKVTNQPETIVSEVEKSSLENETIESEVDDSAEEIVRLAVPQTYAEGVAQLDSIVEDINDILTIELGEPILGCTSDTLQETDTSIRYYCNFSDKNGRLTMQYSTFYGMVYDASVYEVHAYDGVFYPKSDGTERLLATIYAFISVVDPNLNPDEHSIFEQINTQLPLIVESDGYGDAFDSTYEHESFIGERRYYFAPDPNNGIVNFVYSVEKAIPGLY